MRKLSTGKDSTLENWLELTTAVFGEDSPQADFLKGKAEESPNGLQEEVIADEGQLLNMLINLETVAELGGDI